MQKCACSCVCICRCGNCALVCVKYVLLVFKVALNVVNAQQQYHLLKVQISITVLS